MRKPKQEAEYSLKRVALMLHVSPQLIVKAIEDGKLSGVKDNGSYRIPKESMRAFMKTGNPFQVDGDRHS